MMQNVPTISSLLKMCIIKVFLFLVQDGGGGQVGSRKVKNDIFCKFLQAIFKTFSEVL